MALTRHLLIRPERKFRLHQGGLISTLRAAAGIGLCVALAACGGGSSNEPTPQAKADTSASASAPETSQSTSNAPDTSAPGADTLANLRLAAKGGTRSGPPSAQTLAVQKEGARLNTQELARIAKTGELPPVSGGPLLSGQQDKSGLQGTAKAASTRTAVYRFFNISTQAHFFTTSETERDMLQNTLSPPFSYEGVAFYASATVVPDLSPVYRFYNTQTGVHFYTINEQERAYILANLPQFQLEGIAYYASTLGGSGYTPLYRFFYAQKGFHFYTNSVAEKDNIIANVPQYSFEGIAYYVLGDDWINPAVPHTGVDDVSCFGLLPGNIDYVGDCSDNSVFGNQDGQRTAIKPMSYSAVGGAPLTHCVKDNVTRLIWEGKTSSSFAFNNVRSGANTYTKAQADAYVTTVNGGKLCGFNDWRLPTQEELQSIVHYGLPAGLRINTAWFPNTQGGDYWSSEAPLDFSNPAYWVTNFASGSSGFQWTDAFSHVRLVRGAPWSGGPRHILTTMAYSGDAANNAVFDRKTGLSWRRCLEGQSWSGSACTGAAAAYTHRQALQRADSQSGWRLPNVKELGSLPDRSRVSPALPALGATVLFPGVGTGGWTWASSPYVGNPDNAWLVDFGNGYVVNGLDRDYSLAVRLVQTNP